jgi:uncharacterized protein YggE
MQIRSSVLAALAVSSAACAHAPAQAVAQAPTATARTISVTGTATTRVVPDTVAWHVVTTATHAKLKEAKGQSDTQMAAILKTVRALGVVDADLQTGKLQVTKEHERGQHGNLGAFRHFKVTRQITIKERDVSAFDRFLTGLVSSADLEVSYNLATSEITRIRAETRIKAVKAARDKASAMLEALDETLGQVITLGSEGGSRPYYPARTNLFSLESARSGSMGSGQTFAPGMLEVHASVNATFAIR